MTEFIDLDFSIEEDALMQALIDAKGKRVEVIAFGIVYAGTLNEVDVENGTIVIVDGDDRAKIEVERVESLSIVVDDE